MKILARWMLWLVIPMVGLAEDEPRRISQASAVQVAMVKVPPEYSAMARQLRIQGSVQLDVVIAEDGSVARVDILSGNPVLTKSSSEAMKKWHFKPFLEGDRRVKVVATFDFDFKL